MDYTSPTPVMAVYITETFERWLCDLNDRQSRARIDARLLRIRAGHLGVVKPLRDGIGEIRLDFGPGYRLYLKRQGRAVVVLLCGGDKGSQRHDIERAIAPAHDWENEYG